MNVLAYKHQNIFYRKWKPFELLFENDNYYILKADSAILIDKKYKRKIKDKIIWILFKNSWYNIVIYLSKNNEIIQYYCNISSPVKKVDDNFEYIDYDLDIKIKPSLEYKIVDLKDFNKNRLKYNYDTKIVKNCFDAISDIKNLIKNQDKIFTKQFIENYLSK